VGSVTFFLRDADPVLKPRYENLGHVTKNLAKSLLNRSKLLEKSKNFIVNFNLVLQKQTLTISRSIMYGIVMNLLTSSTFFILEQYFIFWFEEGEDSDPDPFVLESQ